MTFLGWIHIIIEFLHFPEFLWRAQSEVGPAWCCWCVGGEVWVSLLTRNTRWRRTAGCVWRRGTVSLSNGWCLRGFDTRTKKRATVSWHLLFTVEEEFILILTLLFYISFSPLFSCILFISFPEPNHSCILHFFLSYFLAIVSLSLLVSLFPSHHPPSKKYSIHSH